MKRLKHELKDHLEELKKIIDKEFKHKTGLHTRMRVVWEKFEVYYGVECLKEKAKDLQEEVDCLEEENRELEYQVEKAEEAFENFRNKIRELNFRIKELEEKND